MDKLRKIHQHHWKKSLKISKIAKVEYSVSRAVKKFLISRLIRHKFVRAEASRDILKFRVSEMPFPGVFKRFFHRGRQLVPPEYIENTLKTGSNAVEMSQVFHDIAWFEHFTDLNLFLKIYVLCHSKLANSGAYFLFAVMVEGNESSRLRMAN